MCMKTKLSVLALAICGMLAFSSCDDDDNNYQPETTITKSFDTKYPNADRVKWESKHGYEVADFHEGKNDAEAWFDKNGNWLLTKTEIDYGQLPQLVRESLEKGEYGEWRRKDIDKVERFNTATVYVIEVEQGNQEIDLYYAEDGTLIKFVIDDDNDDNNNFQPVTIPQAITDAINEMYPGATILEYDTERNSIEVDIRHNNIYKDVTFDLKYVWISTEWDITASQVPAIVMDALKASDYRAYKIDDIDLIERPAGIFYMFELEQGDNEIKMLINSEGIIESTQKD